MSNDKSGIVCHAPADKCCGCDHYHGKATHCQYDVSPTVKESLTAQLNDTPRTDERCKQILEDALGLECVANELQYWAEKLEGENAALRQRIVMIGKSATPAEFVVEQNKMLREQNAALREQLVQTLAIAKKYEPDKKTSYVKYASDEIAELLKEKGK